MNSCTSKWSSTQRKHSTSSLLALSVHSSAVIVKMHAFKGLLHNFLVFRKPWLVRFHFYVWVFVYLLDFLKPVFWSQSVILESSQPCNFNNCTKLLFISSWPLNAKPCLPRKWIFWSIFNNIHLFSDFWCACAAEQASPMSRVITGNTIITWLASWWHLWPDLQRGLIHAIINI